MRLVTYRVLSFVFAVALSACGTPPPSLQRCATTTCGKGTRCDLATELCVQDLGPNVHLVPFADVVTASTVELKGSVSDDTAVKLAQVLEGGAWAEVPLVDGHFTAQVEVGSRDSESVTLEARAFDSLDQEGHASLEVTVDDVGPTLEAVGAADGGLFGASVVVAGRVRDGSGTVASLTAALPGGEPLPVAVAADGTFSYVSTAPSGLDSAGFTVTFAAVDGHGNASELVVPLLVDTVGPTGTIDSPVEAALVAGSVVMKGTVRDTSGVATVRVHDATGWVDARVTGNDWSATLTLAPGDNVAESLDVELTDSLGNVSTLTRHVMVDTVAPQVTFPSIAENASLGTSPTQVSFVADDGPGTVVSVTVSLDGQPFTATPKFTNGWSVDVALPVEDHVQHTLVAVATDAAGNTARDTRHVWVDRVAPTLTITSPIEGQTLNATAFSSGNDVVVQFAVTDGDPLVNVTVNGAPAGFGSSAALVPTSPSDNGVVKTVVIVATDVAGNSTTQQVSFTVDRVPPTVTIVSPLAGALYGGPNVTTLAASIHAQDGSRDIGSMSVSFGGVYTSQVSETSPFEWTGDIPLPTVDHVAKTLRVIAVDRAGNWAEATASVMVDLVPPTVTVVSPAKDAKFNASNFLAPNNDVTVSWTVTDGDASAGTTSFNGGAVSSAARSGVVTTSSTDNPKAYAPVIVVKDAAGNATSVTAGFSVDRVAPTLLDANAKDHDANVEPRALTYSFSEPIVEDAPATFTTTRGPLRPGAWNAAHTTFTSGLFDPDSVVSASMQRVHDGYGNPWATASSFSATVHMAVAAPSGTLASGVASYDVSADANGVPTVAVKYLSGEVEAWTYSAATGLRETTVLARASRPNLQTLKAVAGLKLGPDLVTPIRISGVTTYSCVLPLCATPQTQDRKLFVGGVEVAGLSTSSTTPAALVIPDPSSKLTSDGAGDFGRIDNKLYTRGAVQLGLGIQALGSVSSPTRWAALSWGTVGIQFTHVDQLGSLLNAVTQTVSTSPAPANVSFAIDANGSCFSLAMGSGLLEYPAGHTCTSVGCSLTNPVATTGLPNARVASFSPGSSERSLLILGHDATGTVFRKQKATATCDAPMVDVQRGLTMPAGTDFRPIQLGNKPAIAYLDASSTLQVYVP